MERLTVQVARCDRCGRILQVAIHRREHSKPFRRAKAPKGLCPDCVVTEWIYNTYPVNMIIEERGPDLLLHPLTRDAFAGTILQGCEMEISEIDWQRVVANWSLPVNVAKHNPTNPYRMGDAAGRREAGWPRAGLFASEDVRRQRNATSEKQRRKDESG